MIHRQLRSRLNIPVLLPYLFILAPAGGCALNGFGPFGVAAGGLCGLLTWAGLSVLGATAELLRARQNARQHVATYLPGLAAVRAQAAEIPVWVRDAYTSDALSLPFLGRAIGSRPS